MSFQHLAKLDVVISRPTEGGPRVELVDRRTLTEVISLTPGEARLLAIQLMERGEAARDLPPLPRSRTER